MKINFLLAVVFRSSIFLTAVLKVLFQGSSLLKGRFCSNKVWQHNCVCWVGFRYPVVLETQLPSSWCNVIALFTRHWQCFLAGWGRLVPSQKSSHTAAPTEPPLSDASARGVFSGMAEMTGSPHTRVILLPVLPYSKDLSSLSPVGSGAVKQMYIFLVLKGFSSNWWFA